jgi:hypothetical protein
MPATPWRLARHARAFYVQPRIGGSRVDTVPSARRAGCQELYVVIDAQPRRPEGVARRPALNSGTERLHEMRTDLSQPIQRTLVLGLRPSLGRQLLHPRYDLAVAER